MKRTYLDYAAATPLDGEVFKVMEPFFTTAYANPSALHKEGVFVRGAIEEARRRISTLLAIHADEIIFTGGATESVNLALIGSVRAWKAANPDRTPHVIVSAIEHDAVLESARVLEREGVRVTRLPVDQDGIVDLNQLRDAITFDTVVVAVMYANNEIGTIEPIAEIAKCIRKWKKEERGVVRSERSRESDRYPLLYTDASQAGNYCDMRVPALGVDMLTLSSGKMYGPKGSGLLYVARGIALSPISVGGGQEKGIRAGTEHVAGIVGLAAAFEKSLAQQEGEVSRLTTIRDNTTALLRAQFPNIVINGSLTKRLPNNINFSLPAVDHEFLAIALDARGFAVATKSACSETDAETSHVLLALRTDEHDTRPVSGLRVTLGRDTKMEDMTAFIAALVDIAATMLVTFE